MEELRIWLYRSELILLDVRPRVEYQAGHLPGAISLPVDELASRLSELPRNQTIVVYCRGPYSIQADNTLMLLTQQGWRVLRLEEGVLEWQLAGYILE